MTTFNRQPAFWIGFAATAILAISGALSGPGIFVPSIPQTIINLITILTPVVTGLIIRYFVTPVAAPVLPIGTTVTTPDNSQTVTVAK